jgi:hypothetical protein
MIGRELTFSFGFKDNTAKEGHLGKGQGEVTDMQRRVRPLPLGMA